MQVLYDLIHSLSKDEKRIYHANRPDNRLRFIYDAYQNAAQFDRGLDRTLYESHYKDASRAFYSMQKRELMDELLSVLLYHSNQQNPHYQFYRLFAKSCVLQNRMLYNGAMLYLNDAYKLCQKNDFAKKELLVLGMMKETLPHTTEPSLSSLEEYVAREVQLQQALAPHDRIHNTYIALQILRKNYDKTPQPDLSAKAQALMDELTAQLPADLGHDLLLLRLQCDALLADITNTPLRYHQQVTGLLKNHGPQWPLDARLRLTNQTLRSALRVGDFLLIGSLIYKTDRELPGLTDEQAQAFLPDYREVCSLFRFYENEAPRALNDIKDVLEQRPLADDQYMRCVYYRQAMLLASYLPDQAQQELRAAIKQLPTLANNPLNYVLEALIGIEKRTHITDLQVTIDRYINELRQQAKDNDMQLAQLSRNAIEALQMVQRFLEHKQVKETPLRLFPEEWENLLRVDLYLMAKQKNKFYHNLLIETWQKRKQVL